MRGHSRLFVRLLLVVALLVSGLGGPLGVAAQTGFMVWGQPVLTNPIFWAFVSALFAEGNITWQQALDGANAVWDAAASGALPAAALEQWASLNQADALVLASFWAWARSWMIDDIVEGAITLGGPYVVTHPEQQKYPVTDYWRRDGPLGGSGDIVQLGYFIADGSEAVSGTGEYRLKVHTYYGSPEAVGLVKVCVSVNDVERQCSVAYGGTKGFVVSSLAVTTNAGPNQPLLFAGDVVKFYAVGYGAEVGFIPDIGSSWVVYREAYNYIYRSGALTIPGSCPWPTGYDDFDSDDLLMLPAAGIAGLLPLLGEEDAFSIWTAGTGSAVVGEVGVTDGVGVIYDPMAGVIDAIENIEFPAIQWPTEIVSIGQFVTWFQEWVRAVWDWLLGRIMSIVNWLATIAGRIVALPGAVAQSIADMLDAAWARWLVPTVSFTDRVALIRADMNGRFPMAVFPLLVGIEDIFSSAGTSPLTLNFPAPGLMEEPLSLALTLPDSVRLPLRTVSTVALYGFLALYFLWRARSFLSM